MPNSPNNFYEKLRVLAKVVNSIVSKLELNQRTNFELSSSLTHKHANHDQNTFLTYVFGKQKFEQMTTPQHLVLREKQRHSIHREMIFRETKVKRIAVLSKFTNIVILLHYYISQDTRVSYSVNKLQHRNIYFCEKNSISFIEK